MHIPFFTLRHWFFSPRASLTAPSATTFWPSWAEPFKPPDQTDEPKKNFPLGWHMGAGLNRDPMWKKAKSNGCSLVWFIFLLLPLCVLLCSPLVLPTHTYPANTQTLSDRHRRLSRMPHNTPLFTSWSVKGLRSPIKRLKILHHLKRLKTDITLLQETHLTSPDFHRMKKLWVGTVLSSDAVRRKAGLLILIHKNLSCEVLSVGSDNQGRFLTANIHLGNKDILLWNVYAPNNPRITFFGDLSTRLLKSPHTPHVIGGDFNSILHMPNDRSSPKLPRKTSEAPRPDPFLYNNGIPSPHWHMETLSPCRQGIHLLFFSP